VVKAPGWVDHARMIWTPPPATFLCCSRSAVFTAGLEKDSKLLKHAHFLDYIASGSRCVTTADTRHVRCCFSREKCITQLRCIPGDQSKLLSDEIGFSSLEHLGHCSMLEHPESRAGDYEHFRGSRLSRPFPQFPPKIKSTATWKAFDSYMPNVHFKLLRRRRGSWLISPMANPCRSTAVTVLLQQQRLQLVLPQLQTANVNFCFNTCCMHCRQSAPTQSA
jgi:hypothetical protein